MRAADEIRLDNPAYAALIGPHAHLAEIRGGARRYPADMAPFLSVPSDPGDQEWQDAIGLVAPGTAVATIRVPGAVPHTWELIRSFEVVQMIAEHQNGVDDPDVVALDRADVPEMVKLALETNPGPFLARTIELGDYFGIRRDGGLVAMAGERLHVSGWTEISAVCTAASHRGQGMASRLVRAVLAGIERRDERAFLHTGTANTVAIGLYEALGFRFRRRLTITPMSPRSSDTWRRGLDNS
jgi:predicted GNAT family acetyltransferase